MQSVSGHPEIMTDKTEIKCDSSRLIIPNRPDYVPLAGIYAGAVSKKFGFDETTAAGISRSLVDTLRISFEYSSEQGELCEVELSFDRTAEGLRISILEKGMPTVPRDLDYGQLCDLVVKDEGNDGNFYCLNNFMDGFEFINLGPKGRQTVLIKRNPGAEIADGLDVCSVEHPPKTTEIPGQKMVSDVVVRRMRDDEAIEVARAVYRTYGYSYGYEQVYFPERLARLNQNDEIMTAVAVDEPGNVVGTLSIMRWEENSTVAEIGQGVVIPSYRNSGVFSKLVDFQMDLAISSGLKGFFALAVTNHTFSQKTASRFQGRDCAILLNYIPDSVDFRGFDKSWRGRISVVVHFRDLEPGAENHIYPPIKHESFIRDVYRNLGRNLIIASGDTTQNMATCSDLNSHVKVIPALRYARITVGSYGNDFIKYLRKTVRELLLNGVEIINLFLDLSHSATASWGLRIEESGFFFAGIMPRAAMGNDALVLQYLKGNPINYESIKIESDFGRKILDYIKANDPNWQ